MRKGDRQKVFEKFGGRCAYCGCELDSTWQVDHAISKQYWFFMSSEDPKAVNVMENYMPACRVCNHYKRCKCINSLGTHVGFRDYMLTFHNRLAKLPKQTRSPSTEKRKQYMMRIAATFGITPDNPFNGIFYFEKQVLEQ